MPDSHTVDAEGAQDFSRSPFRSAWSSLTQRHADQCRRLDARWNAAVEIDEGTRAAAYLAHVGASAPFSTALRYHPHLWCPALQWRVPALLAAVTPVCRPRELEALTEIWLDPFGVGQLRLPRTGLFGFSPRGVVALDPFEDELVVGRRLDDAIAAGALLGMPAVAAISRRRLQLLVLPPSVKRVVIALNADSGSTAAEAFAERQGRRGVSVIIQRPPEGKRFWSVAAREAANV